MSESSRVELEAKACGMIPGSSCEEMATLTIRKNERRERGKSKVIREDFW